MAKEGVKFLYGSAVVIGAIAAIQYFSRQKRLLKDISISNTSLDWQTILSGLISSQSAADIQGIPLTLSVVNNSDIDVIIKDADLDVSVDGISIGVVSLDDEEEIKLSKNSETQLDLSIKITVTDWLALGVKSNDIYYYINNGVNYEILSGSNVYKIRGNFVISASIFETLSYPYLLVMSGNQITEEVSGS